jgi:hypothetical protein
MVEIAYMKTIHKADKEAYEELNNVLSANDVEDEDLKEILTTLNNLRTKWLDKHFEEACEDCDYERQEEIISLEIPSNRKILEQRRIPILENLQRKYNKNRTENDHLRKINSNLHIIKTSKLEKEKADLINKMMEQDLQK